MNKECKEQGGGPQSPEGKARSSQNARKHGLLAQRLSFRSDDEKEAFARLWAGLKEDWKPQGITQEQLVVELALLCWKIQIVMARELLELDAHEANKTGELLESFLEHSRGVVIPGLRYDGSADSVRGWQYDQLTLRMGNAEKDSGRHGRDNDINEFAVEAKLTDGLEKMQRYATTIARRRDKVIQLLRLLQGCSDDD